MGKITITGIDQNGNQTSETIEVPDKNRTFYTIHRYQSIGTEKPGLHMYIQKQSWWKRLVLRFFDIGKWKTVDRISIKEPEQGA